MAITECTFSHICELDGPFRAGVHKPVAALWVEFGSCDDLGQLLHIGGLYVDDIKALILDVQVPEVDAQVVAADVRLPVAVD